MENEKKKQINSLVKQIANGDEYAFECLYNIVYKELFQFLRKYTFNVEDIKDVIENTFLIVIRKSKSMLFYKNCYSWLFSIAKYQMFNLNRKLTKEIKLDDLNVELEDLTNIHNKVSFSLLVENLPKDLKLIFYLRYKNMYTIKETSKITKLSESTIKRKLSIIKTYFEEINNEEREIK